MGRILIVFLIIISSVLFFLSTTKNDRFAPIRNKVEAYTIPVITTVSYPFRAVGQWIENIGNLRAAQIENEKLRAEISELKFQQMRDKLRIDRMERLEDVLHVETPLDIPTKRIAARVISETSGPFAHSVLVNVGENSGVKQGYPLMNEKGMLGHVIRVGATSSRVLLLKDLNSRVSIVGSSEKARGILLGKNDLDPQIEFFDNLNDWEVGGEIFTSGDGGVLPKGCLLYTSPSPRDQRGSRMPSSA